MTNKKTPDSEFVRAVSLLLFASSDVDAGRVLEGVQEVVESERRLGKALRRLLDARVGGTVSDQHKARQKGAQALKESFTAQHEAGDALRARPCLDPDKMHGAADAFGGSDFPDFD